MRLHLISLTVFIYASSLAQTGLYTPSGSISGATASPANGNVGIGVSDPTTKLQVKGGAFQQINVDNNSGIYLDATATSEPKIGWRVSDNSERFRIHFQGLNTSTERLAFYKNLGGEREVLSVLSNGNVGIGTNTPGRALDVAGDATANNFYLRNAWNGAKISGNGETVEYLSSWYHSFNSITNSVPTLFLNARSGNVGIGTTDPQAKLQVRNGAIMASDPVFNDINVRINGTSIPAIRFTRYTGQSLGLTYHNAFVGQFLNANEYSFAIGTGSSASGDQDMVTNRMTIMNNGNVGIGTINPDAKLAVKGQVHAQEVKVDLNGAVAPDYVFEPTYTLPSLDSVESYINQNKHLPEVPSAREMEANGVNLGEMNMLLLKKVEELTLYVIELEKRDAQRQMEIKEIRSTIMKK